MNEQLSRTGPRGEARLAVVRSKSGSPDENLTVTIPLSEPPLQVVRPEIENSLLRNRFLKLASPPGKDDPLSFITTLAQDGDDRIKEDQGEIGGVDLTTADWEVVESSESRVVFFGLGA